MNMRLIAAFTAFCIGSCGVFAQEPAVVRSAGSGSWSHAATWQGGQVPKAGMKVLIARGHEVVYDVDSTQVIRSVHLDGILRFATDKNTRLETGLIRIGAGGTTDEFGFDCDAHAGEYSDAERPALWVGSPQTPVDANHQAVIRLHYIEGMDKQSCPAIVCCGGRMELHGAPLERTWLKLGSPAAAGDRQVTLAAEPQGWRVGDHVIVTATTRQNKIKKTFKFSTLDNTQTEQRVIQSIHDRQITLDPPLEFNHIVEGDYRGEVADLSRSVIVESADPAGVRGHTMYHRNSAGSISYAEFRHLGKEGVLGRYSIHFHQVGDTMRGSSVIGASIWDSDNRWITIHGTNYLVVRDCVGYQSKGHGFFMEDGTEIYNVLDGNLAVQAYIAKKLPDQVLPYDLNDGSGFWWANSLNTFTGNVAADCDEYGYFFQATKTDTFDPVLRVRQPDGSHKPVDIRTLPFVRFEGNEAHCQRRHSLNLGGGTPFGKPNVDGIGPDIHHPFVISKSRFWDVHWSVHPVSPSVLIDDADIHDADYGIWRPEYQAHSYRAVHIVNVIEKNHYAFVSNGKPPNADADYPRPLEPVDDLPPITVITQVDATKAGTLLIRGTTSDNGVVREVKINGQPARDLRPNFAQWQIELSSMPSGKAQITAQAMDQAGNRELTPHQLSVMVK